MLVPDSDQARLRDEVEEKFPTASTARLTFDVDRWADVAANGAAFDLFVRPRDLDPALGPGAD
jgi:phosphohistidine phosphatase